MSKEYPPESLTAEELKEYPPENLTAEELKEYHYKRLMECIKANIDVFKRLAKK